MRERLPLASSAFVAERARELVDRGRERLLLLTARPRWNGPESFTVNEQRVHVREAVSHLAALAALDECPAGDYLILLTDRTPAELGDAVVLRAFRQRTEPVDEWTTVPGLFGAQHLDPSLRRSGAWVPGALLEHQPADGWPRSGSGWVTADYALGNLLGEVLGLTLPVDPDIVGLLTALESQDTRSAWARTDDVLREGLTSWAKDRLGPAAEMILSAAARVSLSPTAIGLALDVLWPPEDAEGGLVADQGAARGRVEEPIGVRGIAPDAARAYAEAARTQVLRFDLEDPTKVDTILGQAEALLGDLGWAAGAERSNVLEAGLTARFRDLAAVLNEAKPNHAQRVEGALRDILDHERAHPGEPGVIAARMAVRVSRWLTGQGERTPPTDLGSAMGDYLRDGAWLDRAATVLWDGSADPAVAASYRKLFLTARTARAQADEEAGELLAQATERNETPKGTVLIEHALETLVHPIAKARPLVILLDGMSAPVASELAEGLAKKGWIEHVQAGNGRVPVLAALPTLTKFSRTAFFTGQLTEGGQSTEKTAMRNRFKAPLFHKDDLRSPAGHLLPDTVRKAIDDNENRVVGVVLNTIDDALAKHDPGGTRWTPDGIQHLTALLDAAAFAGRAVVLTSDHGHVVERDSEYRAVAGGEARWRPTSTGKPGKGEVLVRGPRVLVEGGEAVLPWREDLRFTTLRSGYHGGASLAEITVPFLVFSHVGSTGVPGWSPAPPQAPTWWNEADLRDAHARRAKRVGTKIDLAQPLPATDDGPQGTLDLGALGSPSVETVTVEFENAATAGDRVAHELLASETYAVQRKRAGRRALGNDTVTALVRSLVDAEGRAHRDTLAAATGTPASSFQTTFAALRRLLNADGYQVVSLEADGVFVSLDPALLAEQFDLKGSHA